MINKCPTENELIQYLDNPNKLIEKHLVHCDKCLNTVIYLKQNEKEIKSLSKEKKQTVNNIFYKQSIAASFILFLSFFIYQDNNKIENLQMISNNDVKNEIYFYDNYTKEFNQEINSIVYSEDEIIIKNLTTFDNNIFEL